MAAAPNSRIEQAGTERPVDLGGLGRDIGFALRLAQLAVFKDITRALRPMELRPSDFSVLLIIEANPGLKQQALGEALAIQKPNLVSILDTLANRGLLERRRAPGDRRSYSLYLTAAGEGLLARAKAARQDHAHRVELALGDAEAEDLLAALRKVAELGC